MNLTSHLISLDQAGLRKATEHNFLRQAGNGSLNGDTLRSWLSQDAHYARAYIGFVGGLVSHLPLPSKIHHDDTATMISKSGRSPGMSLHWRILDLLVAALTNVKRELEFFEETARRYGLEVDKVEGFEIPNAATAAYIEHFRSFTVADRRAHLLRGLITLWATEFVSLP